LHGLPTVGTTTISRIATFGSAEGNKETEKQDYVLAFASALSVARIALIALTKFAENFYAS
jgi:hypothetical protein